MDRGDEQTILSGIKSLRARWLQVHLFQHLLQALFYLLVVAAVVLLAFPALDKALLGVTLLGLSALAAGVLLAVRQPSQAALAKEFDDVAGLQDRVSSSFELRSRSGPMVQALTAEAASAANALQPAQIYPYRIPREGWWLPLPAFLIAGVLLLPSLSAQSQPDPLFEESLERRITALEDLLSTEEREHLSPKQRELQLELEKLKAELSKEKVDRKDTQAEVARLLDQLEQERAEQKKKELELKKMLKSLQEDTGKQDLEQQIKNGEYQQALNKLREELEKLEKQLEKMKQEGASEEELKKLEELIEKLKEIEAKLMRLMQLNMDLMAMGPTIDFLTDWDGELGDLADLQPAEIVEPGEP